MLGVNHNNEIKAYPIAILNYLEIVNDSFGGVGIVVTFRPLCGTGMAFQRNAAGKERTFGVSGLLYNSDVLLYDSTRFIQPLRYTKPVANKLVVRLIVATRGFPVTSRMPLPWC